MEGEKKQVNLLMNGQIVTFFASEGMIEFGKYIWISPDKGVTRNQAVIVAIASLTNIEPIEGKIEFHKIVRNSVPQHNQRRL